MRTCMLHLSSVVVFISTIILCFITHMFFTYLSTCVCTHWKTCISVFIRYIFHIFYLYFAWYNCFLLACLKHLHLKCEGCVNITLCHILFRMLWLYTFCILSVLGGLLCHTKPLLATPFINACMISNLQRAMQDI